MQSTQLTAKRTLASRMLNTYYTPATVTLAVMESAAATPSLNFYKFYKVAANVCSTSGINFSILVLIQLTGIS